MSFAVRCQRPLALTLALWGLLATASCDFAPTGDPPLSESGPFVATLLLTGQAHADTLVLPASARLSFQNTGAYSEVRALRIYVGERLVGQSRNPAQVDVQLDGVPDGLTTFRVEGTVAFTGAASGRLMENVVLGSWPLYVETSAPLLADATIEVEEGFVQLRWRRQGRRLPDEVEITRRAGNNILSVSTFGTTDQAVVWRDSLYTGGTVDYLIRARNANGERTVGVSYANAGPDIDYVTEDHRHTLMWKRPRGARIGAYVLQRQPAMMLIGQPSWDDVATLDSTARQWSTEATYGEDYRYRLAVRPDVAGAALVPYPDVIEAFYGTTVASFNGPEWQTYLYDATRDVYYVTDGQGLGAWTDAAPMYTFASAAPYASVTVSPDGRLFTYGRNSNIVRELHPTTLVLKQQHNAGFASSITPGIAAAERGMIALAGLGKLHLYDFDAGQAGPSSQLPSGTRTPFVTTISRDGTWIAVSGHVFERTGDALVLRYSATDLARTAFDLDARLAYTVSGSTLRLIDLRTGAIRTQHTLPAPLTYLSADPVAPLLGGEGGGQYHVLHRDTFEPVASIPLARSTEAPSPTMRGYQVLNGRLFTQAKDPALFYAQRFSFITLL